MFAVSSDVLSLLDEDGVSDGGPMVCTRQGYGSVIKYNDEDVDNAFYVLLHFEPNELPGCVSGGILMYYMMMNAE